MLRHRSNDGNIVLSIAGIQKGVKPSCPGSNLAGQCKDCQTSADDSSNSNNKTFEKNIEVVLRQIGPEVVNKSKNLAQTKDSKS